MGDEIEDIAEVFHSIFTRALSPAEHVVLATELVELALQRRHAIDQRPTDAEVLELQELCVRTDDAEGLELCSRWLVRRDAGALPMLREILGG